MVNNTMIRQLRRKIASPLSGFKNSYNFFNGQLIADFLKKTWREKGIKELAHIGNAEGDRWQIPLTSKKPAISRQPENL